MRQEDLSRVARDEVPLGPAWVRIGKSFFYRPDDLRRWIADFAVIRGKVHFDKRKLELGRGEVEP
jgi:hypothetical protein